MSISKKKKKHLMTNQFKKPKNLSCTLRLLNRSKMPNRRNRKIKKLRSNYQMRSKRLLNHQNSNKLLQNRAKIKLSRSKPLLSNSSPPNSNRLKVAVNLALRRYRKGQNDNKLMQTRLIPKRSSEFQAFTLSMQI